MVGRSGGRMLTEPAERVAEDAYRGLRQGRRVVVPGLMNKAITNIVRFIPRKFLLRAIERHNHGIGP